MDKLEQAQVLIQELSSQVYKHAPDSQQDQSSFLNGNELEESEMVSEPVIYGGGAQPIEPSRKKLTEAEREKLSIIKRKLLERKQQ